MQTKKILVTGSIAYDVLLHYEGSFADALAKESLGHLSVSFFTPHYERHHGGTGANVAWTLKLLASDPLLVGTVGEDGGAYTTLLEERKIRTDRIECVKDRVTATAIIATDDGSRQIAFFHPGADSHGHWPDLSDDREEIGFAIVSARDARLMVAASDWCAMEKIPLIFDPGQQIPALGTDELSRCIRSARGIVVNEYESAMIQSRLKIDEAALAKSVPFLLVTLGERGVYIYQNGEQSLLGACTPDRVVNPTGAGDAFRAGLLTGLVRGWSVTDSAKLGASVASFVVEQEGTLLETLDLGEVSQRMEQAYGANGKLKIEN